MIKYVKDNIINSQTDAIVNTVNTVGVMGKGIALAFKNAFPENFKIYEKACKERKIDIGRLLITETGKLYPRYIINFPTKVHWKNPSKYEYIELGLKDLIRIIREYNISSISIPPLGSGNGKLKWSVVKDILESFLSELSKEIDIIIFEPGYNYQETEEIQDVELTESRGIFLYLLKSYKILGYQLNLLVAQKIAYFLQIFGQDLRLKFEQGKFGPYSHNLSHFMSVLNNNFIKFKNQSTNPNTIIELIYDKYREVDHFVEKELNEIQKRRVDRLIKFIDGFESPYGLELLATIHFIYSKTGKNNINEIIEEIGNWTERKKEIMKPNHIQVALSRLKEYNLLVTD